MGGGEAKQQAYYTSKESEEMLFNTDQELKNLDLFSKQSGTSKEEVEALRSAKYLKRYLVGEDDKKPILTDFRDNPATFAAYEKYKKFVSDRKTTLTELEQANKYWNSGRNQTILTTDVAKTILGGAK